MVVEQGSAPPPPPNAEGIKKKEKLKIHIPGESKEFPEGTAPRANPQAAAGAAGNHLQAMAAVAQQAGTPLGGVSGPLAALLSTPGFLLSGMTPQANGAANLPVEQQQQALALQASFFQHLAQQSAQRGLSLVNDAGAAPAQPEPLCVKTDPGALDVAAQAQLLAQAHDKPPPVTQLDHEKQSEVAEATIPPPTQAPPHTVHQTVGVHPPDTQAEIPAVTQPAPDIGELVHQQPTHAPEAQALSMAAAPQPVMTGLHPDVSEEAKKRKPEDDLMNEVDKRQKQP